MAGEFEGRKLVVVGGSSGMGRAAAVKVVEGGGSAVIIGRNQAHVTDTVDTLAAKGQAWGITADLDDRERDVTTPHGTRDDAAWSYPDPLVSAVDTVGRNFAGSVAFDKAFATFSRARRTCCEGNRPAPPPG